MAIPQLSAETNIATSGGTLDNCIIGGTTPAAGSFTTLATSGTLTLPNGASISASSWYCSTSIFLAGSPSAGASAFFSNGTIFTGGTGTTTAPYVYFNQGATAPTNFSTAGTYLACNAVSGFAGNFLHFAINGTKQFTVSSAGNIACGTVTASAISGTTLTGTGVLKATSQQLTGISTKTSAYTCTAGDDTVLVNATSAAVTITLETSPVVGQRHTVKKIDTSTNAVTITAGGTVKIDAGTTSSTTTAYTALHFQYDGTQWWLV